MTDLAKPMLSAPALVSGPLLPRANLVAILMGRYQQNDRLMVVAINSDKERALAVALWQGQLEQLQVLKNGSTPVSDLARLHAIELKTSLEKSVHAYDTRKEAEGNGAPTDTDHGQQARSDTGQGSEDPRAVDGQGAESRAGLLG